MTTIRSEDMPNGQDPRNEAAAAEPPQAAASTNEPPYTVSATSPHAEISLGASTTSAASGISGADGMSTSSPSHAPTASNASTLQSQTHAHSYDGTSSDPTSPPDTEAAAYHPGAQVPAQGLTSHPSQSEPEPQDSRSSTERTAEARAALLATLANAGTHATGPLEQRAADMAANNAALARQEEGVRAEAAGLARMTAEYGKVADEARGKLKELGHVQNWAEMLERDLLVLEETMRIVDEGNWGDEEEEEEGRETQGMGKGKGRSTVGEQRDSDMHDADIPGNEGEGGHQTASAEQVKGQKKGWASWW